MADIRPFQGIRYNPAVVGDLSKVVCPPYDIISPAQAKQLGERSPYNAVRLELPQSEPQDDSVTARYARAAELYRKWLDDGVLLAERRPAMYLLEEEFSYEGVTRRRRGLMAVVRLEEYEKGIILPHEYTTPGPKADRLALMKACKTNFSPIMSLYRDQDGAIAQLLTEARRGQPDISLRPNGQAGYDMWIITDSTMLLRISSALADLRVFVADGHHRYETALQYLNKLEASEGPLPPDAAARFMLMTLISMDDPGLLVLPYHRLVGGLTNDQLASLKRRLDLIFEIEPLDTPRGSSLVIARAIEDYLAEQPREKVVIVAYGLERGKAHRLTLRETYHPAPDGPPLERCDMWILHHLAIHPALGQGVEEDAVTFVHDAPDAITSVREGANQMAFLLRPLSMELFEAVVSSGERLPPKSTYFYPKLPTGLVINSLEGELQPVAIA